MGYFEAKVKNFNSIFYFLFFYECSPVPDPGDNAAAATAVASSWNKLL